MIVALGNSVILNRSLTLKNLPISGLTRYEILLTLFRIEAH